MQIWRSLRMTIRMSDCVLSSVLASSELFDLWLTSDDVHNSSSSRRFGSMFSVIRGLVYDYTNACFVLVN